MVRTRNFTVRKDVVERGSVTKSQKGKKACVERKVGECFQWKAHGQCSKGDSCDFSHDIQASGNSGKGRRRKRRSYSPASHSQNRLTARDKHPHRDQAVNRKTLLITVKFHADSNSVKIRRVNCGTLPCVWITSLKKDVYMATNAISDMLRQKESSKKSKKGGAKDQLLYWRSLYNWVVSLKILIRENLFYVNLECWESKHTVKFSKGTWHQIKNKFGKERVHREVLSKSVRHMSVVLARRNSRKDHMLRPWSKNDAPAKQRGIWRKIFTSSRTRTKLRFIFLVKRG